LKDFKHLLTATLQMLFLKTVIRHYQYKMHYQ